MTYEKLENLGIEVLEHYCQIISGEFQNYLISLCHLKNLKGGLWYDVNIQPKRPLDPTMVRPEAISAFKLEYHAEFLEKNIKICPHYELLSLIAEIIEIKADELTNFQKFCGVFSKPIMATDPFGSHAEEGGVDKKPLCCCWVLRNILIDILRLIEKHIPQNAGGIKLDGNLTESDIERAKEFFTIHREYLSGRKIMSKLKKTVPQLTLLTEDFSEKDIIDRLKLILTQLETQASGNESFIFQPVCEIAPKAEHAQWLHY